MAVDIAPRNASGAALGVVGIASYIGAGLQDVMSGVLIEGQKTVQNERQKNQTGKDRVQKQNRKHGIVSQRLLLEHIIKTQQSC